MVQEIYIIDDDKMINGDFYVSQKGNDSNDGTKDAPFKTIEKAIEAVRNTDKTTNKSSRITVRLTPNQE